MKDHRKRSNTAEQGLEKVPRSLIRRHGDVSHAKARPCLGGTAAARGKLRVDHRHGRAYNGVMNPGQAARTVLSRPPTLRKARKSKEIADIATRLRETRPDLDTPADSESVMQRARELIAASRRSLQQGTELVQQCREIVRRAKPLEPVKPKGTKPLPPPLIRAAPSARFAKPTKRRARR